MKEMEEIYKHLCEKCMKPTSMNVGLCLDCLIESVKKVGAKVALRDLPDFWIAEMDIKKQAAKLIEEHHKEAATANIAFIFRKKHGKSNSKIMLGTCSKQSEKLKVLHGFDFIIELAFDMWALLGPAQRQALLLYELLHIYKDEDQEGNTVWKTDPHNVEEFDKVIGLWKPDLESMAQAMERHVFKRQLLINESGKYKSSSEAAGLH